MFFDIRARCIDLIQDWKLGFHSKGGETRSIPGFSLGWRKKGLDSFVAKSTYESKHRFVIFNKIWRKSVESKINRKDSKWCIKNRWIEGKMMDPELNDWDLIPSYYPRKEIKKKKFSLWFYQLKCVFVIHQTSHIIYKRYST